MTKEHWDNSFSDTDFVYGESANIFIQTKSELIPAKSSVACFAEGEGRNAIHIAKQGHDVTTYDQSVVGLDKTNELAAKNNVNVHTIEMDLTQEKVNEHQYDAAIMVFGHVQKSDQAFLMDSLINAVKPGGYIIFEVYSEDQLAYKTGGPPAKEMLYNPSDVLEWMQGEKCLHFYYGEAERTEGKRHTGTGHVIQVVLEKK